MNMNLYRIPKFQKFNIGSVLHISPKEAFEAVNKGEAVIIDVRETDEIEFQHIEMPDVLYHPMSVILERVKHIPNDRLIIVACPGGIRSCKVVNLLLHQGFSEVANLDGGMLQWYSQGLPYKENITSGCGCSSKDEKPKIAGIAPENDCSGGCCDGNCC